MNTTVSAVMEPLIRRKVFATEEEAVRSLLRQYILQQIDALQRELACFERKHGMRFEQFAKYLHERSILLEKGELSSEQRLALSRAIMQEEDDWLDWKVTREMLEGWLGFRHLATYPHHHHDAQGHVRPSPLTGKPLQDIGIVLQEVAPFLEQWHSYHSSLG